MLHHHDDHIGKRIAQRKTFYEADLLEFINKTAPKGGIYIDVGANIGNHSVFFMEFCANSVYGFEPNKKNLDVCLQNTMHYDYIMISPCGLSDREFKAESVDVPGNMGMSVIKEKEGGDVEITTLDNILFFGGEQRAEVNFIKVDCEGDDMAVLRGAKQTIAKYRPHLSVEAKDNDEYASLNKWAEENHYEIIGKFCATPTYYLRPKQ